MVDAISFYLATRHSSPSQEIKAMAIPRGGARRPCDSPPLAPPPPAILQPPTILPALPHMRRAGPSVPSDLAPLLVAQLDPELDDESVSCCGGLPKQRLQSWRAACSCSDHVTNEVIALLEKVQLHHVGFSSAIDNTSQRAAKSSPCSATRGGLRACNLVVVSLATRISRS